MPSMTTSTRTFMTTPPPKEDKPAKKRPKALKINLATLLIVFLVLFSVFMVFQYREAVQKRTNPSAANSRQVNDVIASVRKLIILPADETPTVATVLHADKLKSQAFFVNAKDGDKVLVYSREKQAILYRPSTNQLVTVSSVTVTPTGNSNLSQ